MGLHLALLTSPASAEERYGDLAAAASFSPSFGLLCLAAVAEQAGHRVTVLDASAENLSVSAALERLRANPPHLVGISATTSGIPAAAALAAEIKRTAPGIPVILGGPHVSALPEATLRDYPAVDVVVIGEGEHTLREILDRFTPGAAVPDGIPGTATRRGGNPVRHAPRERIADLDELPLPAWHLLEGFPARYTPSPLRINRSPCASVVLTRGCPNACTFCDRSVFGSRCRSYSPAYAVRMLQQLHDRFGVREFLIEDDTFVLKESHVREFCDRLASSGLDLSWSCLGRADRVSLDLLKTMRAAGCWHIAYGIESGAPEILERMNKRIDLAQICNAVAWSRAAGMRTKGFFIIGFPGETQETLAATIRFARSLKLDEVSVNPFTPFPGSRIYDEIGQHGVMQQDWSAMNITNIVFVPHGFTRDSLLAAEKAFLRSFYFRPSVAFRLARRLVANPRLVGATARLGLALTRKLIHSGHCP